MMDYPNNIREFPTANLQNQGSKSWFQITKIS